MKREPEKEETIMDAFRHFIQVLGYEAGWEENIKTHLIVKREDNYWNYK